jgi:ligand-binding sensor domain-containing protein
MQSDSALVFSRGGGQGDLVIPFCRQPNSAAGRLPRGVGRWARSSGAIFGLVWSALVALGAVGSGEYFIDVTTGEKGLPNSSVTAIAQTLDGYLWVGTYNGLARFDGERFVKFYPENTPGLRNARIRRLTVGGDGTLWISAHDGSITAFRAGQFTLEWPGEGLPDSAATMISGQLNTLGETQRPAFLLRTGEIIRWNGRPGTNHWDVLRSPGASSGMVVAQDGTGAIWCSGRDRQLVSVDGGSV